MAPIPKDTLATTNKTTTHKTSKNSAAKAGTTTKSTTAPNNNSSSTADTIKLGEHTDFQQHTANQAKLNQMKASVKNSNASAKTVKLDNAKAPNQSTAETVKLDSSDAPTLKLGNLENGNSAASTVPSFRENVNTKGKQFWRQFDDKGGFLKGPLGIYNGAQDVRDGKYVEGGHSMLSGGVDLATSTAKTLAKDSVKLLGKLDKAGTTLDVLGVGLNAYQAVNAGFSGNEVEATEKGFDTLAGVGSLSTKLPGATAALEASLAADAVAFSGGTAIGVAAAAGAGWSVGRAVSKATGLDGVVTNGFEKAVYNDGLKALDRVETRSAESAAHLNTLSSSRLQQVARSNSKVMGQAIVGTLTDIENANKSGDTQALAKAQTQLQRLRAAQRGELGEEAPKEEMRAWQPSIRPFHGRV